MDTLDICGFLDSLPALPRLLGLGEPTHGVEDFLETRDEVFRRLVADGGYRSIAFESSCLAALAVEDYVTGGAGTLDEVLATGLSHGLGTSKANRDLVSWLRQSNVDREVPVRFYGFDAPMELAWAPSPRPPLAALHDYLATHLADVPASAGQIADLAGDDARWADQAAMLDATKSVGRSAEAVRLRLLADDLGALLVAEAPTLLAESADAWWRAGLLARTAAGLLRHHAAMADPAPTRMNRMCAMRDAMMADNLAAIAAREADRGPTLVFAHNSHLQREPSTMRLWGDLELRWWSAGAITAARQGSDYAFVAMDAGTVPGLPEPRPGPDTLNGVLAQDPAPRRLYHTMDLTADLGARLSTLDERRVDDYRYAAFAPHQLADADGVLFLREVAGWS